jgi:hypothetical protein
MSGCKSLNSLKSLIKTKNTKVPAHYYVGCKLGQILHARLRMNCSALNAHLFIRNLVESPNCICGITETVSHFLFYIHNIVYLSSIMGMSGTYSFWN